MNCKFSNIKIKPFMSFGKMPMANGFLKKKEHLIGMDVVIVICGGNVSSTILKQITA